MTCPNIRYSTIQHRLIDQLMFLRRFLQLGFGKFAILEFKEMKMRPSLEKAQALKNRLKKSTIKTTNELTNELSF